MWVFFCQFSWDCLPIFANTFKFYCRFLPIHPNSLPIFANSSKFIADFCQFIQIYCRFLPIYPNILPIFAKFIAIQIYCRFILLLFFAKFFYFLPMFPKSLPISTDVLTTVIDFLFLNFSDCYRKKSIQNGLPMLLQIGHFNFLCKTYQKSTHDVLIFITTYMKLLFFLSGVY